MKCKICDKEIEKSSYSNEILCSQECHTKNYWIEISESPSRIVVNGVSYHNGGMNNSHNGFMGFDGRMFYIEDLRTGNKIKTNNLWLNGDVPEDLKEVIPTTHRFITEEEYNADREQC